MMKKSVKGSLWGGSKGESGGGNNKIMAETLDTKWHSERGAWPLSKREGRGAWQLCKCGQWRLKTDGEKMKARDFPF